MIHCRLVPKDVSNGETISVELRLYTIGPFLSDNRVGDVLIEQGNIEEEEIEELVTF